MKRIAFLFGLAVVAFSLLSGADEAAAQQPADDGTDLAVISRNGTTVVTRVLREARDPDAGRPARAGGIIVRFRPGIGLGERDRIVRMAGALASERLALADAVSLRVPEPATGPVLALLRSLREVASAEPDLIARRTDTPNDPCFSAVPNPCSTTTSQWGMTKINAPTAWNTTTGSSTVRIAVLDCGIYEPGASTFVASDGLVGHPDLRGTKVVDRVNFTTSSQGADDMCNHGTHVAGIAAANTQNGVGVAGVGYDSRLVNVKVLGDNGSGSSTSIINGILWAAGCDTSPCGPRRAEVINMSLGGAGGCPSAIQSAIDSAWSQGLVIVAAAGNSNTSAAFWPAVCNNVLAVSASASNDTKASFSNFGSWVDVAAPGASILSSEYTGIYAVFNGTSMAAPHVAGLAGLLWSTPHGTSPSSVVERIRSTADTAALAGSVAGRIDAAAAVAGVSAPLPDFAVACSPSTLNVASGASGQSTCTVTSTGGFTAAVTMGCSGLVSGVSCGFAPPEVTPPANGSATTTVTVSVDAAVAAQTDSFGVTATSGATKTAAMTLSVPASSPPPSAGSRFLFAPAGNITVGGLSAAAGDIVEYDGTGYALLFDGSDLGVSTTINAVARLSPTELLMSFTNAVSLPGAGFIDDSDLVLFTATSLGSSTAGSFSLYFDGSDIGLGSSSEDLDAVSVLPDGTILMSTTGNFSISGLNGNDEDVFACIAPTTGGSSRCGSVAIYIDASDLGLSNSSEGIDGLTIVGTSVYLSTRGSFSAGGVAGGGSDIVLCSSLVPGASTSCASMSIAMSASASGLAGLNIAALSWVP